MLRHQAANGFQLQLTYPNGTRVALDYRVSSDGSGRKSGTAGGVGLLRPTCRHLRHLVR